MPAFVVILVSSALGSVTGFDLRKGLLFSDSPFVCALFYGCMIIFIHCLDCITANACSISFNGK